jgi:phenylpyruvate tautomerase PptA (4-oxalocrotonate tautomerase family)
MPLLQFDITGPLARADREAFAATVTDLYVEHMDTTAGHVAVTVRERDPGDLSLGRAVEGRRCFLDAEVRRGRSHERKRAFALAAMAAARERWGVPEPNLKVVFTEHAGEDMMGVDRIGGEWRPEDDPGE